MQRVLVTVSVLLTVGFGCVSDGPGQPAGMATYSRQLAARPQALQRKPERARPPRPMVAPTGQPTGAWYPRSGRISSRWTTIVIHHSATERGGAKTFDKYHRQKGWDELGYHFVIGNGTETADGLIEVGPRWNSQKHGAHCKTPDNYYNEHGIGICLVGDFSRTGPTRRQLDSLNRLVHFLSRRCGIPPQRITTHHSINGKTDCPGRHFAVAPLRRISGSRVGAGSLR